MLWLTLSCASPQHASASLTDCTVNKWGITKSSTQQNVSWRMSTRQQYRNWRLHQRQGWYQQDIKLNRTDSQFLLGLRDAGYSLSTSWWKHAEKLLPLFGSSEDLTREDNSLQKSWKRHHTLFLRFQRLPAFESKRQGGETLKVNRHREKHSIPTT